MTHLRNKYIKSMDKKEKTVSLRLTKEALEIMASFASKMGVSKTAVVEMALRNFKKGNSTD